tara:strand:- start:198 stop:473 length:276 start_codon:yes stop_codon:yes gene_type:complete
MILKVYLTRRKFILTSFSTLILSFFLISKENKDNIDLTPELKYQIQLYNLKRLDILKNDINFAIADDLIKNKTVWIGKKLHSYAEIFSLIS